MKNPIVFDQPYRDQFERLWISHDFADTGQRAEFGLAVSSKFGPEIVRRGKFRVDPYRFAIIGFSLPFRRK